MMNREDSHRRCDINRLAWAILFAGALFPLWASLMAGCQSPPHERPSAEAERHWSEVRSLVKFQLATQQYEQSRIDDALVSVQEAIQLDPQNPAFHMLLARCCLEKGALGAAAAAAEQAAAGGTTAELAYLRGMIAEGQHDFDNALNQFRQASTLAPQNAGYLIAEADALVALDRLTEAWDLLQDHRHQHIQDGKLALVRANLALLLGDLDAAAVDLAEAENLIHQGPIIREQYGLVLVRLGRYAEALGAIRPLLGKEAGQPGEDRADLAASPTAEPGPGSEGSGETGAAPAVIRALAECYIGTGSPRSAQRLLEGHLRSKPGDSRAWWLLAQAEIATGDLRAAMRSAARGENVAPGLPQWQLVKAYAAWRQGDADQADRVLQAVLAKDPASTLAHCLLGEIRLEHQDSEGAESHFRAAARIDPGCAWAQARLSTPQSPPDGP